MKKNNNWNRVCLLASGLFLSGLLASSAAPSAVQPTPLARVAVSSDWIVKSEDCICGVSVAHQISNPARIDHAELMKSTPEMKELRKKRIDKKSAKGQALVSAARDRVRTQARSVMKDKGYCSVWSKISNKKNRQAADITQLVMAKL